MVKLSVQLDEFLKDKVSLAPLLNHILSLLFLGVCV